MVFLGGLFRRKNALQREQEASILACERQMTKLRSEIENRLLAVARERFPERNPEMMAALVREYCTGELDKDHVPSDEPADECVEEKALAAEIMALAAPGLYGLHYDDFSRVLSKLPPTLESVRAMSLCYDQTAGLLAFTKGTDYSKPQAPVVDRAYVNQHGLRLLKWATDHDPDAPVLLTTIAQTYYSLGEVDNGFEAALHALEVDSQNAEAWRLLGNGHTAKGRYEAAWTAYRNAIDLNPKLAGVREAMELLKGS